jgi:hypothetical protein
VETFSLKMQRHFTHMQTVPTYMQAQFSRWKPATGGRARDHCRSAKSPAARLR